MNEKGKLYIVATPIGNLGDITLRALETLKSVDAILCEDTRVTSGLLARYEIKKTLISYHQHSDEKKLDEIKEILESGKSLALVTDAGTPGISDPGNWLINNLTIQQFNPDFLLQENRGSSISPLRNRDNSTIIPVPGVSAVVTALSISGFSTDKFLFLGFPPHKKGRQTFFREVAEAKYTVAFYESSHRIKKCLDELNGILGRDALLCVCRELTKKFETIYRGTIEEIIKMDISEKGEFVVVVSNS